MQEKREDSKGIREGPKLAVRKHTKTLSTWVKNAILQVDERKI